MLAVCLAQIRSTLMNIQQLAIAAVEGLVQTKASALAHTGDRKIALYPEASSSRETSQISRLSQYNHHEVRHCLSSLLACWCQRHH